MRDMRRRLFIAVVSALGVVAMAAPAGATEGSLVRESNTNWSTPSTDPTGLTYDPRSHKFWISDSEVDETGFCKHRNLFLANRLGALQKTRRVDKATVEPGGDRLVCARQVPLRGLRRQKRHLPVRSRP